jgi:hypothetical protein
MFVMMRIALVLVLATITASARAEPDPPAPAETDASAWLAAVLDARAKVPAPSKGRPLDHVIDSPAKSCRALRSGRATTAAAGAGIER